MSDLLFLIKIKFSCLFSLRLESLKLGGAIIKTVLKSTFI
ncbi:hypothetical protein JCM19274_3943 [Algibacter lectus]|uniref:Uncharacterized protein n=1 Tax=Algibacter lectus TaxID=221126 RepID=A0A090X0F7_9FLAO|nr:hypothetical protein JCM19274_3943 [Algibacter lectus]